MPPPKVFLLVCLISNLQQLTFLGSYKSMPREKVHITEKAIQIRVPPTGMGMGVQRDLVTLTIKRESILKILAHFGKSMPLLFLFLDAGECDRVRKQLKMTSLKTGLWFDMSSAGTLNYVIYIVY